MPRAIKSKDKPKCELVLEMIDAAITNERKAFGEYQDLEREVGELLCLPRIETPAPKECSMGKLAGRALGTIQADKEKHAWFLKELREIVSDECRAKHPWD
jgi:hypothetical protein